MTQCADDARIACPLFQAEYGGEVPTSALQLHVGKINRKLFQELNRAWHSRLPECTNCFEGLCYGAEYGNKYYAVGWFSHPIAMQHADGNTWELRRMAIAADAPKNTASRFMAIMIRLLKRDHPELTRIISYQDTEVHKGTIYKASGWSPTRLSVAGEQNWMKRRGKPQNNLQTTSAKVRWELDLRRGNKILDTRADQA